MSYSDYNYQGAGFIDDLTQVDPHHTGFWGFIDRGIRVLARINMLYLVFILTIFAVGIVASFFCLINGKCMHTRDELIEDEIYRLEKEGFDLIPKNESMNARLSRLERRVYGTVYGTETFANIGNISYNPGWSVDKRLSHLEEAYPFNSFFDRFAKNSLSGDSLRYYRISSLERKVLGRTYGRERFTKEALSEEDHSINWRLDNLEKKYPLNLVNKVAADNKEGDERVNFRIDQLEKKVFGKIDDATLEPDAFYQRLAKLEKKVYKKTFGKESFSVQSLHKTRLEHLIQPNIVASE